MTISTTINENYYDGDGVQTVFQYTFKIFDESDMNVYVGGVIVTSGYTISNVGAVGGGNVTFDTAPVSGTGNVALVRKIPLTQGVDLVQYGQFNAEVIEESLDKAAIMAQQQAAIESAAIRAGVSDPTRSTGSFVIPLKDARKGRVLAFNETSGDVEAGPVVSEISSINAIAQAITDVAAIDSDVTTVAGLSNEVALLGTADAVADMNTLATADIVADMNMLATADVVADMNLLATTAVIEDLNILANADVLADMNTLATADIVSDMNTLATADVVSDMNTLATADVVADMNMLATPDVIADMNLLATAAVVEDLNILANADVVADMNTLATAAIVADLDAVADIEVDVTKVAAIDTDVTTVAGIDTQVTTVAGDTVAINNITTNLTAVQNAAQNAIDAQNAAAAAAASYDSFDDRYLGAKSVEPTVNNDGDPLISGNLYFHTGSGMKVYDGATWIDASAASNVSMYVYEYTATAGQTTFSGADDNSQTLSYTAGNIIATYGGFDLPTEDYTATNGTSVVLDVGAEAGKIVRVIAFTTFQVADTYTQAQIDAKDVLKLDKTGGTLTGAVTGTDLTLSGGIYLGGTAAANKLDDYETGTWTPTYIGSTTAGTSPTGVGTYTKVGRLVTVTAGFSNKACSGAVGNMRITGLPFTPILAEGHHGAVTASNLGTDTLVATVSSSGAFIGIRTAKTSVWKSVINANFYLYTTVTYEV